MTERCDEWSGEQDSAAEPRSGAAWVERPAKHRTARRRLALMRAHGPVAPFTDGAFEPVVNHFTRFGRSRDDVQPPVSANLAGVARPALTPFAGCCR